MRNKGSMWVQSERRLDINLREGEGKCWTVVSSCASSCGCAGLMFGAMLGTAGSLDRLLCTPHGSRYCGPSKDAITGH